MTGYDVIGEVHGQVDELRGLLTELEYVGVNGVWKHPSRAAVFIGDLIDRGGHQLEVVAKLRSIVEAGSAKFVLGNHEFNAVAWATHDATCVDHSVAKGGPLVAYRWDGEAVLDVANLVAFRES